MAEIRIKFYEYMNSGSPVHFDDMKVGASGVPIPLPKPEYLVRPHGISFSISMKVVNLLCILNEQIQELNVHFVQLSNGFGAFFSFLRMDPLWPLRI